MPVEVSGEPELVAGGIVRDTNLQTTSEGAGVRVELLYFHGCPNWRVADERLREAVRIVGRNDITVRRRTVETPADAEVAGFFGSPTIRIDGEDPFATGEEHVGLACRRYRTPEGLRGSPTVDQFVEALA